MPLTVPVIRVEAPELGLELYQSTTAYTSAKNAAPETVQFVDGNGNVACGGTNGATPASAQDVWAMIEAAITYAQQNRPDGDPEPGAYDELEDMQESGDPSYIPQRMAETSTQIRWCKVFGTC